MNGQTVRSIGGNHLISLATADGVTKHTTLVVVGDQDVRRLNGATISAKHQKARDLIAKGKPLRVVSEADLMLLLAH
jgi:DNA polymerase-3 subunit epsilon